jgi:hypothetical protein
MSSARSIKKTIGLAGLLAVLAMSAVAVVGAASASAALPEYLVLFTCKEVAKGTGFWLKSEGGNCKEIDLPAAGNFEPTAGTGKVVAAGEKIPFTSTSGEKLLKSAAGTVRCTDDVDTGNITGPRTDEVEVTFLGCELVGAGECQNVGVGTKEILTKTLLSLLVYLKETEKLVGLALEGEGAEKLLAEFECEPGKVKIKVTGSVLSDITPVNAPAGQFGLELKCTSGTTEQVWTQYEEPAGTFHVDELTVSAGGSNFKPACEEEIPNDVITMSEPVEIMG